MDAIPFDAPGVKLGHHQNKYSFETIIEKYELTEPGLQGLANLEAQFVVYDALYAWCRMQVAKEEG